MSFDTNKGERVPWGRPALALWPWTLLLLLSCNEQGNIASQRVDFETTPIPKVPYSALFDDSCGASGVTQAGEMGFLRRPYLQKMTATSVEVLWTTDQPDDMLVAVVAPDGTQVKDVPSSLDAQSQRDEYAQHVARIDGLTPETIYCYEVRGENGAWLTSTGFRTAPGPDSTTPIQIIAFGDVGARTSDQFAVLGEIERVQYDLALLPGDLAYESGKLHQFEDNFFAMYEHIMRSIPFFVISGNHDYSSDGAIFREVFALPENGGVHGLERWYSLDWGSVHLVALDTEQVGDEQAAWLKADLAANPLATTIAFLHRPPYSSGYHGSSRTTRNAFSPLFEAYGVDLVIAGHDHNYERTQAMNGVTYVVSGAGGRGTRSVGSSSYTEYSEAVAHFLHITIDPQELRLHAIDATGFDFDTVVLPTD